MKYTVYVSVDVQLCSVEAKNPDAAIAQAREIITETLQLHDEHDLNIDLVLMCSEDAKPSRACVEE